MRFNGFFIQWIDKFFNYSSPNSRPGIYLNNDLFIHDSVGTFGCTKREEHKHGKQSVFSIQIAFLICQL